MPPTTGASQMRPTHAIVVRLSFRESTAWTVSAAAANPRRTAKKDSYCATAAL